MPESLAVFEDVPRTQDSKPVAVLRTLRWSIWLGWQIESNWADIRLFLLYLVVKPVTGSLMLVFMFYAARSYMAGRVPAEFLPYIFISNACYGMVGLVMFGMSYVVISDRESYRMLKYIFISPAQFQAYFFGRGFARAMEGFIGGVITITVGLAIPEIRDRVTDDGFDFGWIIAYLLVGSVMLWAAGMILASAMLNMSRSGMFLSEGVAGVVYFLSGVVFPVSFLPVWAQKMSQVLPTTYWLEGMRRAITGPAPAESPLAQTPLALWTHPELLLALIGTTIFLVFISQWIYRASLNRAWHRGKIEETSGL